MGIKWPTAAGNVASHEGFNYPRSGLNNVAEYQASGLPFVTSSTISATGTVKIDFPFVTNFLTVQNKSGGGDLFLGFTENGIADGNRYEIESGDKLEDVRLRVKTVYIRTENGTSEFSLLAGMTQIQSRGFPVLTGSAAGWASGSLDFEFGYEGLG